MARACLTILLRRKLFWAVYALAALVFFAYFFGQYAVVWVQQFTGDKTLVVLGVPVALFLLGTLTYVLIDTFQDEKLPQSDTVTSTQQVSDSIFGPYLLPFWALSFVLLAAVVGAIVLARKD